MQPAGELGVVFVARRHHQPRLPSPIFYPIESHVDSFPPIAMMNSAAISASIGFNLSCSSMQQVGGAPAIHAFAGADGMRFFQQKVVRDLLWAVTSPYLLSESLYPVLPASVGAALLDNPAVHDWLTALEADPQRLIEFLRDDAHVRRGKNLALGVYFSSLLEYWLRFCPALHVDKFESGTQIVSATKLTVGQLKFLFRCRVESGPEMDWHVESSVKFFLLNPLINLDARDRDSVDGWPLEQFVGPHLGENLAWRVQEVARKLDMCRGDSVQTWLRANYSDNVHSHIVLRGYLFYPLHHFESTSRAAQWRDWSLHRNTIHDENSRESSLPNPSIAGDHLRGWWTSDFEGELVEKVTANDKSVCGESRFVVLPKLHWLAPIIASEDTATGRVVIVGDEQLGLEDVEAVSLSELVLFLKVHFESMADSPETQAKGGVVMPLLIAEIIRKHPQDDDCCLSTVRWIELSRGFILDPKSWDPEPLCREPVRYRRTSNRHDMENGVNEREYGGRHDWARDGVIKTTDEESAESDEAEQLLFAHLDTVSPADLVVALFAGFEQSLAHAFLKASVKNVLLSRTRDTGHVDGAVSTPTPSTLSRYVRECLAACVLGSPAHDLKAGQRVGHLILDAFISADITSSPVEADDGHHTEWVDMFFQVADDEHLWDFLTLVLRAFEIMHVLSNLVLDSQFMTKLKHVMDRLSSHGHRRLNAAVIEMIRVFDVTSVVELRGFIGTIFDRLVHQKNWKNAVLLAVMSCDEALIRSLAHQFSQRNMTKALKRLRKLCVASFDAGDKFEPLPGVMTNGRLGVEPVGRPVDHEHNRRISELSMSLDHTVYVHSLSQLNDLVEYLSALEGEIQAVQSNWDSDGIQYVVVGLDCEWRPQLLANQQVAMSASPSLLDGRSEQHVNDDTEVNRKLSLDEGGLSIYQLAINGRVFVIDVQILGLSAAAPLQVIWKPTSPFVLAGFSVDGDLKRLAHSFPHLMGHSPDDCSTNLLVELKRLARFRRLPVNGWGLSRLYEECFGELLDKQQQCSDWGARPLSASQIEYAAMDAHVTRCIALHLLADIATWEETVDVKTFMRQFDATTPEPWLSLGSLELHPLSMSHVYEALVKLQLVNAVQFHTILSSERLPSPQFDVGRVVKTIALVIKRAQSDDQLSKMPVQYAGVVLQLDREIDMCALGEYFGTSASDISLAGQHDLIRVFGYPRGCVGPIGLRQQAAVQVIVDERLVSESKLLCGAGALDEVYSIAPDKLIASVGATVANISAPSQPQPGQAK